MFGISSSNLGYYVQYDIYKRDQDVAQYLDLSLEEYQNILIKHGASLSQSVPNVKECYFTDMGEAQRAIRDLEPHLIMAKLVE